MLEAALSLLQAMRPLIKRFVDWMVEGSEKLNAFFNPKGDGAFKERQNEIKDFFKKSGDIMAAFGDIFGNLFKGLNNVIMGLMEPGSGGWMLLEYFKKITGEFATWTGTAEGKNKVAQYFKDVATNAIAIMDATGPLLGILGKMGTSPAIKEFADSLADPAFVDNIQNIADKFLDAGPALAEFVKSATAFFDLTLSSGAIQTFWNTLTGIFDLLVKLFENPVIAKGFLIFAQLAATLIALRTAWKLLKIPVLAILNPLAIAGGALSRMSDLLISKGGIVGALGAAKASIAGFLGAMAPIAAVAAIIAGLVAAFVAMWRESEIFRESIKKLIDGVVSKAITIFETLKQKLDDALEPFGGLEGVVDSLKKAFKWLGDVLGTYVVPVLSWLIERIMDFIGLILGQAIDALGVFLAVFKTVWDGIYAVAEPVVNWFKNTVWPILEDVFTWIAEKATWLWETIIKPVWDGIKKSVETVVNWFKTTVWPLFKTVIGYISGAFETAGGIISGVWNGIKAGAWIFYNWFNTTLWPKIRAVIDLLKLGFETAKTAIGIVWDKIKTGVSTAVTAITTLLKPIWEPVHNLLTAAWKLAVAVWEGIKIRLSTLVSNATSPIRTMWDGLLGGLKGAWEAVKKWWNTNVAGKGFTIPKTPWSDKVDATFPKLALGGVVAPRAGGTLALIGEAGRPERVEPLDSDGLSRRDKAMIQLLAGGGSGAVFNIYPSEGMDERELAKLINRELAFTMRKGAA